MARDSIKDPASIKTLMQEMFYESGHSQNNGAHSWNNSYRIVCIVMFEYPALTTRCLLAIRPLWSQSHGAQNIPLCVHRHRYKYIGRITVA
jgi:hypothetical protein